jgi:hypothetical protein
MQLAHNAADDEKKQSPAHGAYKESYAANHAACNQYTLLDYHSKS